MTWKPHQGAQENFLSRGEFEVLFGGAAGPGKTDCLIMEATRYVAYKNYKAVILRRTFPQLQEVIDRCWSAYPLIGGDYRATEHRWYFPSGAHITLGHMQHENDKYNYQGKEFHFITQFLESQYLYLHSRARSSDSSIPPRIRSTTNPGGIGHNWVKRRFISNCDPGNTYIDPETGLSRAFVPALIWDNPTLAENDPAYVQRLKSLPEVEKRRLLMGDWESFDGQFFENLDKAIHGCEPFEIPPEWTKFMVLDWGYSKPFSCGWYAIDYDGVIYRYREWYGCEDGEQNAGLRKTAVEVASGILERESEKINIRIADPSIWNKTSAARHRETVGGSVEEDMRSQGIFFRKANNDRINGWQQIHKRLMSEPDIDKSTGEIVGQLPNFMAFNDQVHFWRTMGSLVADKKNPDDVDTEQEDHIADEFRYACMFKPMKPKKIIQFPKGTVMDEIKKMKKARQIAKMKGISIDDAYRRIK